MQQATASGIAQTPVVHTGLLQNCWLPAGSIARASPLHDSPNQGPRPPGVDAARVGRGTTGTAGPCTKGCQPGTAAGPAAATTPCSQSASHPQRRARTSRPGHDPLAAMTPAHAQLHTDGALQRDLLRRSQCGHCRKALPKTSLRYKHISNPTLPRVYNKMCNNRELSTQGKGVRVRLAGFPAGTTGPSRPSGWPPGVGRRHRQPIASPRES